MLPKFLQFLEELESGVVSPQHEMGEENLSLNKVIEKRIKEIISEFELKGRATEQEVLNSFFQNISKMMGKNPQNKDQEQVPQAQTPQQVPQAQVQGPQDQVQQSQ